MSHVTDFSLLADETPCTILYTIGDQKVDVGVGVKTGGSRSRGPKLGVLERW